MIKPRYEIRNPLGLDVTYRACVAPFHQDWDHERRDGLVEAMRRAGGWDGAPIVADGALAAVNQDQAYTGAHRLATWRAYDDGEGAPVPCVWIEDLCAATGNDWAVLMDEYGNDAYEAAAVLCSRLPAEVRDAYGLDVGGA